MFKFLKIILPTVFFLLLNTIAWAEVDHAALIKGPFKTGPDVTKKCLECHEKQAKEFMQTVHWTWADKQQVPGRGEAKIGKRNVINNFCIALPSNWPRCTSCHAGYGWKDASFDFKNPGNVDCLICHDTTGSYRKFPVGAGHPVYKEKEFPPKSGRKWKPLDLVKIAQSVGKTQRRNCGACHFYGGGGDHVKHGDLDSTLTEPVRELDVHMGSDGANMTCTSCHVSKHHKIPGQALSVSVSGEGKTIGCPKCHTQTPHKGEEKQVYNKHAKRVACQTCHIPTFARSLPTKVWWDWSKAGEKRKAQKDEYGMKTYHRKKGEFKWEKDVIPEYKWFNGQVSRYFLGDILDPKKVTQLNYPLGSKDDAKALITPFKVMRGKQPYDAGKNILVVPKLLGGYWKHYDWNKSVAQGMKTVGMDFSGNVGFTATEMYWKVNHMVVPKERALECVDCHTSEERFPWKALGYSGDPWQTKTKK